jgi:hypothetical protein
MSFMLFMLKAFRVVLSLRSLRDELGLPLRWLCYAV